MALTVLNVSQKHHVHGGSDRYYFSLTRLLESRGHTVVPFAAADDRNRQSDWSRHFPVAADFERPGPRDLVRYVYSAPARRSIQALLREVRPDVAHLHIYYGKLTASILEPLRQAGVPIVQTLHDHKLHCPVYSFTSNGRVCEACRGGRYWKALPRRCNRGSVARTALSVAESYVSRSLGSHDAIDRFIAVSRFVGRKAVEHGTAPAKVSVVHNFVDAEAMQPAAGAGRHFLYFGRLEQSKGAFDLVQAAHAVPDVPVLLVGAGDHEPVERAAREKGAHNVRVLPALDGERLWDLVRDSIATVLPSRVYDNAPMTILESMALSRPAIGSDIGGIPELIRDGVDGLLVPPRDPDHLGRAMRELALDPLRAARMGEAGRLKVCSQFGPDRHYRALMEVYEEVIGRRPAQALEAVAP